MRIPIVKGRADARTGTPAGCPTGKETGYRPPRTRLPSPSRRHGPWFPFDQKLLLSCLSPHLVHPPDVPSTTNALQLAAPSREKKKRPETTLSTLVYRTKTKRNHRVIGHGPWQVNVTGKATHAERQVASLQKSNFFFLRGLAGNGSGKNYSIFRRTMVSTPQTRSTSTDDAFPSLQLFLLGTLPQASPPETWLC
jgi:hypothetical protein